MGEFKLFKLPLHTDDRFSLLPVEVEEHVPFVVKRVYAIIDGQKPSGAHAHKVEQEVFFVARGQAVAVIDDGTGLRDVPLSQGDAIYVGALVWHHFKSWLPGTVVVALSSTPYDSHRVDYITDYEAFKRHSS